MTLRDLHQHLPEKPLYSQGETGTASEIGWLLSPKPYGITQLQLDTLTRLGPCLHHFAQAIDLLYKTSLKEPEYHWVQRLLNGHKPEQLINFSQMKRFRNVLPLVIRPDLLVTEKGFTLCEIDAVPGGIGFTGALYQAYRALGFPLVGIEAGIPKAFLNMLLQLSPPSIERPSIAVIVSDEAADYREELAWLVGTIQGFYPEISLLHPREVTLERNQLGFIRPDNTFQQIHIIYRCFELFDLPNIPQIDLIQYAIKKGLVACTPPFKPHLEEKLQLALLHSPFLEEFWVKNLGEADFYFLKDIVPQTWVLDPAVLPPHAQVVPMLNLQGKILKDFSQLGTLTQKQRELVIKPSGFSLQSWGSRGVKVGHDLSQAYWQEALEEAFSEFDNIPHILQRFENTKVESYEYFNPTSGERIHSEGRTRLCPYYFVEENEPILAGILATTCPKDKKVIHGMRDGVMRPACLVQ